MNRVIKDFIKKITRLFGYDIIRYSGEDKLDKLRSDFSEEEKKLISSIQQYTMTTPERIYSLTRAVKYLVRYGIPGDIVECGVWRGGSMMAVAITLVKLNSFEKNLWLYDTFEGMPKPTEIDIKRFGKKASDLFNELKITESSSNWCNASLDEVKENLFSTGYSKDKIHFIKGKVEDTIPDKSPNTIALLRLDTDFYESTRHELIHLFPRISNKGVLIIDDYGSWKGARKAVDEYLKENNICILLNRIDHSGRVGIKV